MYREPKTERDADTVVRQYASLQRAAGRDPKSFTAWEICEFMTDYVRCGFSSGELSKRNSSLRTYARRLRMSEPCAFPELDSDEWRLVSQMRRALQKKDPVEKSKAVVLSMHWIRRMARSFGILRIEDMWTAHLGHVYVLTRLLVAHCTMMRGCEQRVRLRDVCPRWRPTSLAVNADSVTKRGRKLPLREQRSCTLPTATCRGGEPILAAGAALHVFLQRFPGGADDDFVFGRISDGVMDASKYLAAPAFMSRVVRLARAAGADVGGEYAFTAQGLRLGGRTDWRVHGMSNEWMRRQGGWKGDSEAGYDQPLEHHKAVEAGNMEFAMASMASSAATGAGVAENAAARARAAHGMAGARRRTVPEPREERARPGSRPASRSAAWRLRLARRRARHGT